ncbi:DNA polymerase [Bradyrhizobium cenepequi]
MARTIFMDYETYYDKEYSLRKMTPVEYVLDPRFENILCAVREGHPSNQPTYYVDGADFGHWVKDAKLESSIVVTHNALFDMCVLAWRYGTVPRLMVDTLGVSRAVLGHRLKSLSLASVAKFLGLGVKGGEVHNVIGMSREAIKAAGLWDGYANYSKNDCDLCEGIYDRLVRSGIFPMKELMIADMVLRCAIQPKFMIDQSALALHLNDVLQEKDELLLKAQEIGAGDKKDLMSNDKFAELLKSVGCEPPTKVSPKTGKTGWAFAKTDQEFIELEEEGSPAVQALIAARLGFKSTLEETRTQRLLNISRLTWEGNQQALMPIPLRYSGAHTHRLSGEWKLNMQNLPRGTREKPSQLRRALIAKPGETIMTIDASQIEARINAWLNGQDDLVTAFANGEDVYSSFASEVFGYPVNKKDHPNERFMGKTSILGLGFQVGGPKFQNTIEVQSQLQLGTKIEMSLQEAYRVVDMYRKKYSKISGSWKTLQYEAIPVLAGNGGSFQIGPCVFEKAAILLPNGLKLHYYDLNQTEGERGPQWEFTHGGKPKKLYGGKLLENIVQALARIVTMDAALRIQKTLGLGMQVHDELVYGVRNELVEEFKALLLQEMRRRPVWAPDLPLEAEVGVGQSYGEAK